MNTLYLEHHINRLWKKIYPNSKIAFISCFFIGLLTHLFMLTNKLPNHDDIKQIVDDMARPTSGRWFLFLPTSFSSDFSLPWVNGLLCLFYISVSAAIVVKCLHIKSSFNSVLIGGIMITFPTVCTTLSYMNSADGYFFALLLACIAVYLADKYPLGFLPSILLITLSLGIYQAYFPFAIALAVGVLLRTIIVVPLPRFFIVKASKFIVFLALGLLLYMIITKAIPTELSSYMGIDKMGEFNLSELPAMVIGSYQNTFEFFFFKTMNLDLYALRHMILATMFFIVGLPIYTHKLYLSKLNLIFYLLLIITLPISCNLIYIMSTSYTPHILMIYSFVMIFITLLSLFEMSCDAMANQTSSLRFKNLSFATFTWGISFLFVLLIFNYSILSNQAYFKLYLTYEQSYAYSNRLLSRIENIDGFSSDCHVYFIGQPSMQVDDIVATPAVNNLTGIISDISASYSYHLFLEYYLGNRTLITPTYFEPPESDDFLLEFNLEDMPTYPDDDSIKKIGRNIVVKF